MDPMTRDVREELRALFTRTVAGRLGDTGPTTVEIVDDLMRLCWEVGDDWDKVYITEMRDAGDRWLDQRYIRVRIPREAKQGDHIPDRTVA